MDSHIYLLFQAFLFKSPNIFAPYNENINIDIEKLFSSVSASQNIFMYSNVDYSSLFDLKNIRKSQISIIEGIEIYLGNKKVILMSLTKRNKLYVELFKLIGEKKNLINQMKNSHQLIAEKGLNALDEIDYRVRELTTIIQEKKENLFNSINFSEYGLTKEEIEQILDN